ncbi:MAG: hypothetical protein ACYDCL_17150 [Myxococcales bacterium]
MPSKAHEVVLQIVVDHPDFAVDFLAARFGPRWPGARSVVLAPPDIAQLAALQHRADALLRIETGDGSGLIVVVEVQLTKDPKKLFTWPLYLCGLRAKLELPAVLLVVTPDRAVQDWASGRIALGPGSDGIQPVVFGPAAIPLVTEPPAAEQKPWLALLSALAHAAEEPGVEAVVAAEVAFVRLEAAGSIDPELHRLYTDLMFQALGPKAPRALEVLMQGGYQPQSEIVKGWFAEGKKEGEAKGKAEGKVEGKADALLAVLTARKLAVSEEQRQMILVCHDLALLDRWIARAVTASTTEEALG